MTHRVPITFLITDLHLGGSPRVLRDLALGLAHPQFSIHRSAFSIQIISLKPLPPEPIENQESKIENSPIPPHSSLDIGHWSFASIPAQLRAAGIPVYSLDLARLADLPAAIPRLARLLKTLRPAILYSILIHANTLATLTLPFLTHKTIFMQSIHTLQPRPAWHWTLQGLIAPFADAIVVPAKPILDKIAQHGPFSRGIVIPNGIDLDRFANAAPMPPSELPWSPGASVIGYLGRFDPVKNLPLLLRAFAKMLHSPPLPAKSQVFSPGSAGKGHEIAFEPALTPDEVAPKTEKAVENTAKTAENLGKDEEIHLALVGYGAEEGRLRGLAKALHIASRVHFLGPTSTPERWYKSFSCHCLPSTAEGFGLTLVEALAAGIPVVAVRTPVAASIVGERRNAILIDRPDETLLGKALQMVIDVRWQASNAKFAIEGDGRDGLERFSVREMVAGHERIFQKFSRF